MAAKGSNTGRWLMGVLSVVIVAALILVAVPNMIRVTDCNNREAETKQNLHAIQLAIERYAVDHGGTYPLWLSGGLEVSYSGSGPDFDYIADKLMVEGYMPDYPSNPFIKSTESRANKDLFKLQKDLDDPLSYGSSAWIQNMRFGATGKVAMGNVLADPRFAQMPYIDAKGNQGIAGTGTDVIFRCWDTQQLQEPQYWLQGQFFYKSDAGHYSENDDISVLDFSGDVADNYILGCFGSFRSKGKDILGEEHSAPWWVETGRSAQVWGFHGIPVPGNPLRQGSPFGSSNGTPPSPFQYGNPNGVRDGILLVLTRGEGYDSESIETEKADGGEVQ